MNPTLASRWLLYAAVLAVFLVPAGLAVLGKDGGVVIAVAAACCAAVLLLRLPDIESLKMGPLEAKLRHEADRAKNAADEALATTQQLKQLAKGLSQTVLGLVMSQGRIGADRRQHLATLEETIGLLRELGLSREQLAEVTQEFEKWLTFDLAHDLGRCVSKLLKEINDVEKSRRVEALMTALRAPDLTIATAARYRSGLRHEFEITGELAEALEDLEHYQKEKTLRRPEVYIGDV